LKEIVNCDLAPSPIGAYSQGVIYDRFIFISGQIGIDPITNELISDDFYEQLVQLMKNIENILNYSKCNFENVAKITVFMCDLNKFNIVNDCFEKIFDKKKFPARSVVQVSKLPKDALIEIDTIAIIDE
tara:strand:+ start:260 stop:646 length:387 start_codon:yes stop_codon:yes gene_type:complete